MTHYIKGNLLEADCDYICHQVNCHGKMGSGVAKQVREKWPSVYQEYVDKCEGKFMSGYYSRQMLGDIQVCDIENDKQVINMFAQDGYGYDGKRYTSYDAFWECLIKMRDTCTDHSFAFPYKIASDRGGANWAVIRTMIEEVLSDRKVYFYYLNEDDLDDRAKTYVIAEKYLNSTGGYPLDF